MSELIRPAATPQDFHAFGELVGEYTGWLRTRYADDATFIDRVLGHQSLDRELQALPSAYSPPQGRALLALAEPSGVVCGGGAYRRLDEATCEMKRVFVREAWAGRGLGRRLCRALIDGARDEGYALMRLDTARRLTEATRLYESLGFVRCAPYIDYPPAVADALLFFELRLA